MKKKILIPLSSAFAVIVLMATMFFLQPVKRDTGSSELFSEADILSAMDVVEEKFSDFRGCRLFKLSYAGDKKGLKELESANGYDEAIVLDSRFLSPIIQSGSWNPHEIYTWSFTLMRETGGNWILVNYGYC